MRPNRQSDRILDLHRPAIEELRREMLLLNSLAIANDDRMLDDIAELSNVAWPGIVSKYLEHFR